MSIDELDKLIGTRDHRKFLNTRNELLPQTQKWVRTPPSRDEALKLMAAEPNLIPAALSLSEELMLCWAMTRKLYKESRSEVVDLRAEYR